MERYIQQLLSDLQWARENVSEPWWYFIDEFDEDDEDSAPWMDEDSQANRQSLEALTNIKQYQLPPADGMTDGQVHRLLYALKELLSAFNCHVVFQQTDIPERVQYHIIQSRFTQEVPQLHNRDYFFTFCDPGQDRRDCQLGKYCECNFMDEMVSRNDPFELEEPGESEELDPHDRYLRRKYGRDWEHYHRYYDWEEYEEDFPNEEDKDWWDEEDED
jgi:hypothetical protein